MRKRHGVCFARFAGAHRSSESRRSDVRGLSEVAATGGERQADRSCAQKHSCKKRGVIRNEV